MTLSAKRRRKRGNPYDPSVVHDRRAQDLLRNAQVVEDVVECPYDRTARIEVTRSTRHDPLFLPVWWTTITVAPVALLIRSHP